MRKERKHWLLLVALICVVPGVASADDASAATGAAKSAARGMSFDAYIRLRKGMTEGELLERAGPPDHQTTEGTVGTRDVVRNSDQTSVTSTELVMKTFYYFPTTADPFTTTVTMTGGRISELKRERKF